LVIDASGGGDLGRFVDALQRAENPTREDPTSANADDRERRENEA
jgi:hypothetical protein